MLTGTRYAIADGAAVLAGAGGVVLGVKLLGGESAGRTALGVIAGAILGSLAGAMLALAVTRPFDEAPSSAPPATDADPAVVTS